MEWMGGFITGLSVACVPVAYAFGLSQGIGQVRRAILAVPDAVVKLFGQFKKGE